MTIIYPVPELFPDQRARFIQIINTCYALAERGIRVLLIAGIKKGYSTDEVLRFYGIPGRPNLSFIRLPMMRAERSRRLRLSWHGIFHLSLLAYLLIKKPYRETETVLFLRYIKLADFILRFKKILGLPVVFETHEIFNFTTSNGNGDRIRHFEYSVYNKADTIISISQHLKEYLVTMGVPQTSIHVIQNGIKREWIDTERRSNSYICYTGSLYSWKGIDTLIKAMKYLLNERLVIVGGGGRLEELKNLAETEGVAERVIFVGAVPHTSIPQYLSQAKIAVIPNIPEGPSRFSSPLKLFEYMACGLPIVASDIPVFQEILREGENALLFKSGDPVSLALKIERLARDPGLALKLAAAAKEDAKNYTYDRRAEKIVQVVRDLRSIT
jgi:glycosyltransferase involved in cell wall biosynthesis